jgi:choline dehydrogenase
VVDVVVVGGGAAGCVLAKRVAEAHPGRVLLLEAGPDLRADTPAALRDGWHLNDDFDWGYMAEPTPRGKTPTARRRKLLGGTSWLTRFTPRGAPGDYDAWGSGWTFDDVLPYFTRLESDLEFGGEPWHGSSGPMPVTRYPELEYTEVGGAALAALLAIGLPEVEDHNRPGAVGAGRMPMSSVSGRRVTTADAYLTTTPPNLEIRGDAEVAQVVLEGTRARGVRLLDGTVVDAERVVLCAGVYGSPAILMRSGIGPADHLRALGIDVRIDLAGVGENLADHPSTIVDCGYSGPAADGSVLHAIATFRSSVTPDDQPPDLMIWTGDPEADDEVEMAVVLLKPRSRGRVRLRSADPRDAPMIHLPALEDPSDLERLIEGYRIALEAANQPELRALCSGRAPVEPGDLAEFIRDDAYSVPHVVGTCALGTVVDALGRVHGVDGLTIADASIMPDAGSGFTHFPAIMIAEKLSEAITP